MNERDIKTNRCAKMRCSKVNAIDANDGVFPVNSLVAMTMPILIQHEVESSSGEDEGEDDRSTPDETHCTIE